MRDIKCQRRAPTAQGPASRRQRRQIHAPRAGRCTVNPPYEGHGSSLLERKIHPVPIENPRRRKAPAARKPSGPNAETAPPRPSAMKTRLRPRYRYSRRRSLWTSSEESHVGAGMRLSSTKTKKTPAAADGIANGIHANSRSNGEANARKASTAAPSEADKRGSRRYRGHTDPNRRLTNRTDGRLAYSRGRTPTAGKTPWRLLWPNTACMPEGIAWLEARRRSILLSSVKRAKRMYRGIHSHA